MTRSVGVKSDNNSDDGLPTTITTKIDEDVSSTYSMKDEDNSLTEDNSQEEDYSEEEDESGTKRGRKKRKSHSETKHRKTFMSIDVHAMRSCLHLNQKDAAKKLNVSLSTLKRRFYEMRHELGCDKWPYPPHAKGSTTPTPSSNNKRKSSSSDEEEESSDEVDTKPAYKTRRQSVTSTKRNSICNENSHSNLTTEAHSKSATNPSIDRGSKKLKAAHTGFLSSVPDYKQGANQNNENSDFVFYKDYYEEQSSDEESSPELASDEDYIDNEGKKKVTKCDLTEISKKAQSIENPREKEIYGAAVLLIALKQEQIIPNLD